MNKVFIGLIVLLIAGFVFAVQAGTIFTPTQFANANLSNYDFEMTNEGWSTTEDAYVLTVGAITAKKVLDEQGDWNGTIQAVQVYKDYPYWKERYTNCRTGISPYTYEQETGEFDEQDLPITETIVDSSASGCKTQAKLNIKSRVIADREKERAKLQDWQDELNDILGTYDDEWDSPPIIDDTELN